MRVLLITTEPLATERPAISRQLEVIKTALEVAPRKIDVKYVFHANRKKIMDALAAYTPQVIHFLGHGEKNALQIENSDGTPTFISAEWLVDILAQHRKLRLIVLNACKSGDIAQTILSRPHPSIRGAIGWSDDVHDDDAREFVEMFYSKIASGASTDGAFRYARNGLEDKPRELVRLALRNGRDFRLITPRRLPPVIFVLRIIALLACIALAGVVAADILCNEPRPPDQPEHLSASTGTSPTTVEPHTSGPPHSDPSLQGPEDQSTSTGTSPPIDEPTTSDTGQNNTATTVKNSPSKQKSDKGHASTDSSGHSPAGTTTTTDGAKKSDTGKKASEVSDLKSSADRHTRYPSRRTFEE